MAEDPGGPKGSIRIVIAAFIPDANVFNPVDKSVFRGDNRTFNPRSSACRIQQAIIANPSNNGLEISVGEVSVGETRGIAGPAKGYKGKAKPTTRSQIIPTSDGGANVIVSVAAGNPYYTEKLWLMRHTKLLPPIQYRLTLNFNKRGDLVNICGSHTAYPAFEIYQYEGPKFGKGNPGATVKGIHLYNPSKHKTGPKGLRGKSKYHD